LCHHEAVGIPSGLNGVYGASSVAGMSDELRVKGYQCEIVPTYEQVRQFVAVFTPRSPLKGGPLCVAVCGIAGEAGCRVAPRQRRRIEAPAAFFPSPFSFFIFPFSFYSHPSREISINSF